MAAYRQTHTFPPRLRIALTTTIIAFVVSLLASINLYLLEDANPLTQSAYSAAPLLRFSYDGIYLSALVSAVAICAIIGYAISQTETPVVIGIICVALFIALGGFGGLLIRHPLNFLVLFLVFASLIVLCFLVGRIASTRLRPVLGQQPAAILGACVSTAVSLLVNLVTLVLHTIALNPVSHMLYMQGQIGVTHFNSLLIAMGIEFLMVIVCMLSILFALRSPSLSNSI
jgi:hypothetical protein